MQISIDSGYMGDKRPVAIYGNRASYAILPYILHHIPYTLYPTPSILILCWPHRESRKLVLSMRVII